MRQDILGQDDELRAEHAREHAARQHPRDRPRLERIACGIGGGEAVRLVRRGVEPAERGAETEQREGAEDHAGGAGEPREHPAQRARLERGEPPPAMRDRADRQRADPQADHIGRDRQRRERPVGGEHHADDAGAAEDDRAVAAGERLRACEHEGVPAREPVVGRWLDRAIGNGGHANSFGRRRIASAPRLAIGNLSCVATRPPLKQIAPTAALRATPSPESGGGWRGRFPRRGRTLVSASRIAPRPSCPALTRP